MSKTVWIAGYGSLLSEKGIHREGNSIAKLRIHDAFIAAFHGARGFNKGPNFRMDVGHDFHPVGIQVRPAGDCRVIPRMFECLVFKIDEKDLGKVAAREGYSSIMKRILEIKDQGVIDDDDIARWLWGIFLESTMDSSHVEKTMDYFTSLVNRLYPDGSARPSSSGDQYIPFPVKIGDTRAIMSISSGRGQKGSETIDVMSINRAWNQEWVDQEELLGYFVECITGGVHGISVRDLLRGMEGNKEIETQVEESITNLVVQEKSGFIERLYHDSMDIVEKVKRYKEHFFYEIDVHQGSPDSTSCIERSSLLDSFPGIRPLLPRWHDEMESRVSRWRR